MEIKILDETEMTTYPRPGEAKIIVAVTYQANAAPPRTVWIDKDKLTDETRRAAVKADIEKAKTKVVKTLEL